MEENNESKNEKLKNAVCYIPFVAVVLFFTEINKSKEFMKHIKYWIALFIIYIFLNFVFWWFLSGFLFLIYVWIIWFLFYKVYNWDEVRLEHIDKLEAKIRESFYDTKKNDIIKKESDIKKEKNNS